MKHTLKYALAAAPFLSLGAAQTAPTCETLMVDLEQTAAATQSVTRTLTMKAGERELRYSVVQVVQGENGIEVTTLEERGQPPREREGAPDPQSSLLGLPPGLGCAGHTLTATDDGFELSLAVADEENQNPIDTVVLDLEQRGETLVPLGYAAAGSATQLFFTTAISVTMNYQDWVFE